MWTIIPEEHIYNIWFPGRLHVLAGRKCTQTDAWSHARTNKTPTHAVWRDQTWLLATRARREGWTGRDK